MSPLQRFFAGVVGGLLVAVLMGFTSLILGGPLDRVVEAAPRAFGLVVLVGLVYAVGPELRARRSA